MAKLQPAQRPLQADSSWGMPFPKAFINENYVTGDKKLNKHKQNSIARQVTKNIFTTEKVLDIPLPTPWHPLSEVFAIRN